jgi:hypothetical protein
MKVLAIYAINQHIADLMAEAHHARLAAQVERKPSAIRRFATAVRAAVARTTPDTTPALAS